MLLADRLTPERRSRLKHKLLRINYLKPLSKNRPGAGPVVNKHTQSELKTGGMERGQAWRPFDEGSKNRLGSAK